ncbi:MAG: hypothetical protein ACI86X_000568 [Moritella sp.]|jgi:hypothetical protein
MQNDLMQHDLIKNRKLVSEYRVTHQFRHKTTNKFTRFSHGSIAVIIGAISCGILIIITLFEIL